MIDRLRELAEPFEVCFEASCGYGWLYDRLKSVAARVLVAHPGQLRLIFRSKRKNDRVDAQKLAKLLFLGEVPPVYVPSADTRAWRSLVEHRQRCIAERARCKNGLRAAVLRTHGIQSPSDRMGLWSSRGLQWIENVQLPTAGASLQRDQLIDDVRHHARKVKCVEVAFVRHRLDRWHVTPARTIQDAERFPDGHRVSVAGLVLVRQRPGTASGVVFVTLEDEKATCRSSSPKRRRFGPTLSNADSSSRTPCVGSRTVPM